jgi:TnpA family transposase
LKDDWQSKVFKFKEGAINDIQIDDIASGKLVLPQLPRINKTHLDYLRSQNKQQLANQPWAIGLLESIAMVEIVQRQRIETKNRIALILLDSNFEIALKEFIVHRTDLYPVRQYTDSRIKHLFNQRHLVVREIQKHLKLTAAEISIIEHYYMLRNKLIHERATVGVTDRDIAIYGELVQSVINKLFSLKFK